MALPYMADQYLSILLLFIQLAWILIGSFTPARLLCLHSWVAKQSNVISWPKLSD